jgi:hypothetical protein
VREIVQRVSSWLVGHSSRRGFLAVLGKFVGGTAAMMAGVARPLANDHVCGSCCEGYACSSCDRCDPGSKKGYKWACTDGTGGYWCVDCFTRGRYVCTYVVPR